MQLRRRRENLEAAEKSQRVVGRPHRCLEGLPLQENQQNPVEGKENERVQTVAFRAGNGLPLQENNGIIEKTKKTNAFKLLPSERLTLPLLGILWMWKLLGKKTITSERS